MLICQLNLKFAEFERILLDVTFSELSWRYLYISMASSVWISLQAEYHNCGGRWQDPTPERVRKVPPLYPVSIPSCVSAHNALPSVVSHQTVEAWNVCEKYIPPTGADPGFWSGWAQRSFDPKGGGAKFAQNRVFFPLKLHENWMILKKKKSLGQGGPAPLDPLVHPCTLCQFILRGFACPHNMRAPFVVKSALGFRWEHRSDVRMHE